MSRTGRHIYFTVKYIWKGKKPKLKFVRTSVEKVLIKAYNDWGDLMRPYTNTWNEDYKGPEDLFDEKGYFRKPEESEELRYYQSIYRSFARKLKPRHYSIFIDHFDVGDELELLAVMRNGANVSFVMKEVPYDEVLKNVYN